MSRRFTVDAHFDDSQLEYGHEKVLRDAKPGQINAESKGSDSLNMLELHSQNWPTRSLPILNYKTQPHLPLLSLPLPLPWLQPQTQTQDRVHNKSTPLS